MTETPTEAPARARTTYRVKYRSPDTSAGGGQIHETTVPVEVKKVRAPRPRPRQGTPEEGRALLARTVAAEAHTAEEEYTPAKVRATTDDLGAPALNTRLVERLDKGTMRPGVADLVRADFWNDTALARLLPLTVEEARQLLRRRYPRWSSAVEACFFGQDDLKRYGAEQRPPIGPDTARDRKERGILQLSAWVEGRLRRPRRGSGGSGDG